MAMAGRLQLLFSPTAPVAAAAPCHRQSTPVWLRRPDPRSIVAAASSSRPSSSSASEQSAATISKGKTRRKVTLKLTYLEINSWVWEVQPQGQGLAPLRILVDPLVVGNLDFGAPWLFDGAKKNPSVKALGVDELLAPETGPDLLLITQSLDDHCHVRTLTQLSARAPDLPVVTTPNAQPVLASLPTPFRRVTYLEPGQSTAVSDQVRVLATAGPVLGPPWQRPENGYILMTAHDGHGLLYLEPHCVYDRSFLETKRLRADVVVTPVVKQLLPANFTLVSGQEDAVDLARLLRARYVVPMSNGDVDAGGLLAAVLSKQGTTQSFEALLSEALPQVQVVDPTPGVPLQLELDLSGADDGQST
ncbi:hypothetical protein GQ55_3G489800 [Panicum hallii var. hallii]|uniref:Metallo-beta-lactamase domain-containing protein n=1 Tax=Panicum hallii var. hallii TaxID=1504633 RepID=A0A2T7EJT7_9POAL|nr:hypothetical protein GQ55_3G489800 [Panicum hallii var. hallii]